VRVISSLMKKPFPWGVKITSGARLRDEPGVIPGRACTPSLESRRMEPLSESRPPPTARASTNRGEWAHVRGQPLHDRLFRRPNHITRQRFQRAAPRETTDSIWPRNSTRDS